MHEEKIPLLCADRAELQAVTVLLQDVYPCSSSFVTSATGHAVAPASWLLLSTDDQCSHCHGMHTFQSRPLHATAWQGPPPPPGHSARGPSSGLRGTAHASHLPVSGVAAAQACMQHVQEADSKTMHATHQRTPEDCWYASMKPAMAPRVRPHHMEGIRMLAGVPGARRSAAASGLSSQQCEGRVQALQRDTPPT